MPRRASLRASDEDRENIAERLRHAAGEGRLRTHELEQRIARAFSASTYGELDSLVSDLPSQPASRRGVARRFTPSPIALVVLVPVLLVVAASVALAVAGVLTVWWLWAVLAWFWFGGPRRRLGPRYARFGCAAWHASRSVTRRPPPFRP